MKIRFYLYGYLAITLHLFTCQNKKSNTSDQGQSAHPVQPTSRSSHVLGLPVIHTLRSGGHYPLATGHWPLICFPYLYSHMKKLLLAPVFFILLATSVQAQLHMRKQRLFKVDPVGGLFHELRVSVENRLFGNYFVYIQPAGFHQNYGGRENGRFGKPGLPQKNYGLGLRLGARRYFLPANKSPEGFFVHAMVGVRNIWVHNQSEALQVTSKTSYFQAGIGGMVGYQWLYGPKKNFVYGFIGGFEYYPEPFTRFRKNSDYEMYDVVQNWYDFPFLGKTLAGLRLYLGIEIGFAFLQKDLHW
jgi:hypothetical protein